jgi:eukaryotic translation initiation factor 2C
MITVPGRVLGPPVIKYGGNATETPRGGSWNMTRVKFTSSARVPPWTYFWIKRAGRPGQIQQNNLLQAVVTRFHEMMTVSGLAAPPPIVPGPVIELDANNATQTNDQLIQSMMQRIAANDKNVRLVFVLLPDTDAAVYNRVKYAGDILHGIHTVCSVDAKAAKEKGRDQYLANIALKVNGKLLGVNQSLDMSKLGIIAEGKTMVVGIDVTHPSPGSLSNAPSVAAVVASTDKNLSQFPCELSIQEGRKEMVTDLSAMFKSRLDLWKTRNKTLPENILVYRDGVSEGQYQVLKDTEIPALRTACAAAYSPELKKKGLPKISVIVVGKRHHTRFYATKENEADRSGNPMNGTVVDRGVTSMWNWDFFLQAHTCLQGTAKPAHYYVVLDEIFGKGNLKKPHPFPNAADTLEDLTHNMCYLFARATKAVSICPPAYYADLACERARCYLSGVFDPATPGGSSVTGGAQATATAADVTIHERLRNSMFYL